MTARRPFVVYSDGAVFHSFVISGVNIQFPSLYLFAVTRRENEDSPG